MNSWIQQLALFLVILCAVQSEKVSHIKTPSQSIKLIEKHKMLQSTQNDLEANLIQTNDLVASLVDEEAQDQAYLASLLQMSKSKSTIKVGHKAHQKMKANAALTESNSANTDCECQDKTTGAKVRCDCNSKDANLIQLKDVVDCGCDKNTEAKSQNDDTTEGILLEKSDSQCDCTKSGLKGDCAKKCAKTAILVEVKDVVECGCDKKTEAKCQHDDSSEEILLEKSDSQCDCTKSGLKGDCAKKCAKSGGLEVDSSIFLEKSDSQCDCTKSGLKGVCAKKCAKDGGLVTDSSILLEKSDSQCDCTKSGLKGDCAKKCAKGGDLEGSGTFVGLFTQVADKIKHPSSGMVTRDGLMH